MREATIILPVLDNAGASLEHVHASLAADLLEAFGGFTAATVYGAWKDADTGRVYQDESTEYRVSAEWVGRQEKRLINLAGQYARKAGQEAVYVRLPSGEVELYGPGEAPALASHGWRAAESEAA